MSGESLSRHDANACPDILAFAVTASSIGINRMDCDRTPENVGVVHTLELGQFHRSVQWTHEVVNEQSASTAARAVTQSV